MTEATYYATYKEASQAILEGKALLKTLRKEGEKAAERAKRETNGTIQEKFAAIHAAWKPFQEKIAQVEAEITQSRQIADENFDAWRGLNQ